MHAVPFYQPVRISCLSQVRDKFTASVLFFRRSSLLRPQTWTRVDTLNTHPNKSSRNTHSSTHTHTSGKATLTIHTALCQTRPGNRMAETETGLQHCSRGKIGKHFFGDSLQHVKQIQQALEAFALSLLLLHYGLLIDRFSPCIMVIIFV